MTVRNGVTVLAGGATDVKSETTVYLFVTATLLDDADQPLTVPGLTRAPR